jgi:hypothetical protein
MFEAFVGSFLGISAVLAILTIKDKVEAHRERTLKDKAKEIWDLIEESEREAKRNRAL